MTELLLFSTFLLLGSIGLFAQGSPDIYYQENFDVFDKAKGGNDNQWSGSIAGGTISDAEIKRLKKGADGSSVWFFEKGSKGNKCIKLGARKDQGTATTPKLGLSLSENAVLTFRAGAWDAEGESQKLKLKVIGGGSLSQAELDLEKGKFKEYTVTIIGGTADTQIKFSGEKKTNSRFFLDDVIVKKAGAKTKVETPKFSTPSDEYYEPISVEISSSTAGAIIRYTTDGTEPTEASPQYSKPITVSETTTLKAKAFKEGLEASEVAEAAYTIVALQEVGTLEDLRKLGANKKVKYTGEAVVTFVSNDKKYIYIQDTTGAILIFDNNNARHLSNCEIGSKLKEIIAETISNDKMLRLRNVKKAKIEGTGELEPTEIKLEDLKLEHQAKLVKVKNIKFLKEKETVFKERTNVKIEGSAVEVRPQYSGLDYLGEPIPDKAQTIVAVVLVYKDIIQLVPRSIKEMTPTGLARILAATKLYSTEGKIHFEAKTGDKVEIYNALGQLIYKVTAQGGLNTINAPKGIIIFKIGDAAEKVIVR